MVLDGEASSELFGGFGDSITQQKHGGHFSTNNSGGSLFAAAKHGGWDIPCTSDLVAKTMTSFVFGPSVFSSGKHGGWPESVVFISIVLVDLRT
jgi:hypothetical protein